MEKKMFGFCPKFPVLYTSIYGTYNTVIEASLIFLWPEYRTSPGFRCYTVSFPDIARKLDPTCIQDSSNGLLSQVTKMTEKHLNACFSIGIFFLISGVLYSNTLYSDRDGIQWGLKHQTLEHWTHWNTKFWSSVPKTRWQPFCSVFQWFWPLENQTFG